MLVVDHKGIPPYRPSNTSVKSQNVFLAFQFAVIQVLADNQVFENEFLVKVALVASAF
jgi:hypothetical protein